MIRLKDIALAFGILFSLNINAQQVNSWWPDKPVVIDGDPSEWPQPFRYYDGNTKLQFAIANDTANIYICLKVTDEQAQIRLFHSGLHIWIDRKGKRKESVGLIFPMRQEHTSADDIERYRRQMEEFDPAGRKSEATRIKQQALVQQNSLAVKAFTNVPDQVLPLQNNFGIHAALGWDSLNILTIEYKLPAASALGHGLLATDTSKPVGIGFIIEAMTIRTRNQDENEDRMAGNSGMSGGMNNMNNGMNDNMGMQGRNGMGSSPSHSGMDDFTPALQEQKVWSKLILSWK